MQIKQFLKVSALLLLMSACGNSKEVVAPVVEPQANLVDQQIMSTLWMQHSLEVKILQEQQYRNAAKKLKENLNELSGEKRPAIILDIDETVLDNSPYEARLIRDGVKYTEESWGEWVEERSAELIPGVQEFLLEAERLGVEVFYVSNRSIRHLEYTIENLRAFNLPGIDDSRVLLKEEYPDKTERRNSIKANYEVILYIGDQLSDFIEGQDGFQQDMADYKAMMDYTLKYFVMLPNPMYGSFEKALYLGESGLSDEEKDQIRRNALITKRKM